MPETLPDADTIRDAVERVLSRKHYRLDPPREQAESAAELGNPLREWLWDPLVEFWKSVSGRFAWADDVLAGIVLGVLLLLAVQIVRRRNRRDTATLPTPVTGPADQPSELQLRALEAGERGEHLVAARLLLQASKLRLEEAERRVNRPGTTNRELLRRYRASRLLRPLTTLVETVDRSWFGGRECTRLDYVDCVAAHDEIHSAAKGMRRAVAESSPSGTHVSPMATTAAAR